MTFRLQALLGAVLAVLMVAGDPALAQGRPLYDPGSNCISPSARAAYSTVGRGTGFEVLGIAATRRAARTMRAELSDGIWNRWRRFLGTPVPRFDGARRPYQVFVVPGSELPDGLYGTVAPYCGHEPSNAIVATAEPTARDRLPVIVAHEAFHAFQIGDVRSLAGTWWGEATAAYGDTIARPNPRLRTLRDDRFLQRPQVSLDALDSLQRAYAHEYGAQRFIEWLKRDQRWSEQDLFAMLRDSFRRMSGPPTGAGAGPTDALAGALTARGIDLGAALGRFWGAGLIPDYSRPATKGRRVTADVGVSSVPLSAGSLAADVVRLRLGSAVRQVTIRSEGVAEPGTTLLMNAGGRAEELTPAGDLTWCVRGPDVAFGAPWPGELPIAFTNGRRSAGDAAAAVRIEASADPCADAGGELTESRCKPSNYRRPPAGFTDSLVLVSRAGRVSGSWAYWWREAVSTSFPQNLRSLRGAAAVTDCGQRALERIDHVPARDRSALIALIATFARAQGYWTVVGNLCAQRESESAAYDGRPIESNPSCGFFAHADDPYTGPVETRFSIADHGSEHAHEVSEAWVGFTRRPNLARELARCERAARALRRRRPGSRHPCESAPLTRFEKSSPLDL